jgi:hypothetical protein
MTPNSILNGTIVTKYCIGYNITTITKPHSKFELNLTKN